MHYEKETIFVVGRLFGTPLIETRAGDQHGADSVDGLQEGYQWPPALDVYRVDQAMSLRAITAAALASWNGVAAVRVDQHRLVSRRLSRSRCSAAASGDV